MLRQVGKEELGRGDDVTPSESSSVVQRRGASLFRHMPQLAGVPHVNAL